MPKKPPTHQGRNPPGAVFHVPTAADGYHNLYSRRWQKASAYYRRHHALCVVCQAEGRLVQAKVTDHIVPHKGDKKLFWDNKNWQALCVQCHNKKTAIEDGGFGRKPL